MAVSRRARRRPLAWILLAALVTVLVLIVNAALHTRASVKDNTLAYADEVLPLIQQSTNEGADLVDVRGNAVQLGRQGITRRLDRLVAETSATLTAMTNVVPPASLRVANAYLVATMGVRARAAAEARRAMAAALAEGAPDPAVNGLVATGQDMELGDRAFALFAASLPAGTVAPTPSSVWVANGDPWSAPQVSVFVTTLRSSTSLSPVHDLAVVTFTTDPAPVGNDNGSVVLPPTRGLQVAIVVANVGNEAERHATVTATLHTNGSNTNEMVRDFVDLTPGQTTAVQIGSLHPASGATGTLTVAISTAPGETNLANNSQTWVVELR